MASTDVVAPVADAAAAAVAAVAPAPKKARKPRTKKEPVVPPTPAPVAAEDGTAQPAVEGGDGAAAADGKSRTNKATYLLHGEDGAVLARYRSTSHRNAALKAASKKHTVIRIRKAGDTKVRVFEGTVVDAPRTVTRGGEQVTYRYQSKVRFLRTETWTPKERQAAAAGGTAEGAAEDAAAAAVTHTEAGEPAAASS